LGDAALAGVGAAGNVTFLVLALTKFWAWEPDADIACGGAQGPRRRTLVFNQSLVLSATCALITVP